MFPVPHSALGQNVKISPWFNKALRKNNRGMKAEVHNSVTEAVKSFKSSNPNPQIKISTQVTGLRNLLSLNDRKVKVTVVDKKSGYPKAQDVSLVSLGEYFSGKKADESQAHIKPNQLGDDISNMYNRLIKIFK